MADEKTSIPLLRTKLHKPRVVRNHFHRQYAVVKAYELGVLKQT